MASVKAVYDYTYDYEGTKVSFRKDEEFQLLAKSNKDWWQVRRWNKEGIAQDIYVPAVYVQEVNKAKKESANPTYENIADLKRKLSELEASSTKQNGEQNVKNVNAPNNKSHKLPPVMAKPLRKPSREKEKKTADGGVVSPVKETQQLLSTADTEKLEKPVDNNETNSTMALLQKFNRAPPTVSETAKPIETLNPSADSNPKPRSKSINASSDFMRREAPASESQNRSVTGKPVGKLRIPPAVLPKSQKHTSEHSRSDRPRSMVVFSPTSPVAEGERSVGKVTDLTKQNSSPTFADELKKVFEKDSTSTDPGGALSKSLDLRKTPSPKNNEVTDVQNKVCVIPDTLILSFSCVSCSINLTL